MERADLLEANGGIFKPQGEAINAGAADDVKVLVVGNPANTNALIAMSNAPDVPARAVHGDDAPRPQPRGRPARQQARRAGLRGHQHDRLGQPLADQYPDLVNAKVRGENAWSAVDDEAWIADEFIPRVGKRGAEIIEARGASSAASAANAAIDHVHDWVLGTEQGDWVSMGVPTDGSYEHRGGHHLRPAVPVRRRRVHDRRGPRDHRLLARADRRLGRRAALRARRGRRARADLSRRRPVTGSAERPSRSRRFPRGGDEFGRVLAFSDGLFAIAMTAARRRDRGARRSPTPTASATSPTRSATSATRSSASVISFAVIGRYWVAHHQMFSLLRGDRPRADRRSTSSTSASSPSCRSRPRCSATSSTTRSRSRSTRSRSPLVSGMEVVLLRHAHRHGLLDAGRCPTTSTAGARSMSLTPVVAFAALDPGRVRQLRARDRGLVARDPDRDLRQPPAPAGSTSTSTSAAPTRSQRRTRSRRRRSRRRGRGRSRSGRARRRRRAGRCPSPRLAAGRLPAPPVDPVALAPRADPVVAAAGGDPVALPAPAITSAPSPRGRRPAGSSSVALAARERPDAVGEPDREEALEAVGVPDLAALGDERGARHRPVAGLEAGRQRAARSGR